MELWINIGYGSLFLIFTLAVGRYLDKRGRVFLSDSFSTNPRVADAVASLLNVGFYIVCTGLLLWTLGVYSPGRIQSGYEVLRGVSLSLGISIFVVGVIHFFNILVVAILSRKKDG